MQTTNTIPTGSIRTFGDYGVKYIVGTPAKQLPDGDWLVNIELPESGETAPAGRAYGTAHTAGGNLFNRNRA